MLKIKRGEQKILNFGSNIHNATEIQVNQLKEMIQWLAGLHLPTTDIYRNISLCTYDV